MSTFSLIAFCYAKEANNNTLTLTIALTLSDLAWPRWRGRPRVRGVANHVVELP